jgi:hypothetical protein
MLKSLNDITEQMLDEIKEYASYFFTPKEIALMVEIEEAFFIECMGDQNNAIYRKFQTGRLTSEMELRKCILKLAKSGSSPAQTMSMDILNASKIKMLDR